MQEQLQDRYKALENLFTTIAKGASVENVSVATVQAVRLAAPGQRAMMELYDLIVGRNLDPGPLPIGSRAHISMPAQLMDLSAAFASQHPTISGPETTERCARIAGHCHQLASRSVGALERHADLKPGPPSTLLDRVDAVLHAMRSMPRDDHAPNAKELVALPSKKVPLLVPGGLDSPDNVAFALQMSLCVTACYIFYHAVAWPEISTSVTTVFFTAIGTTGASNQKLFFRILGAAIGGLVFGIGVRRSCSHRWTR